MHMLIIRHLCSKEGQHTCQAQRPDGRVGDEAVIQAPDAMAVEGRPNSNLSLDLRWYLEQFLDYPFSPHTEVAERIQAALNEWGQQAFTALFDRGRGRDMYRDALRDGLDNLTLKIASDDPYVLAWPWEALQDPQISGALAQHARIERQLSGQHDPVDLPELPRDGINILLVTARPYDHDVGYRTLSRPLLDLIRQEQLPARVQVLRPPTFAQLREHLRQRPQHYHIVHFDGHGGYGPNRAANGYQLQGFQGRLIFETADGAADPIEAATLSALLREHRIPMMVLNACQSAMIDATAQDAFASVAAALLQAGVRSVVAMSYALYVSAARVFLPDFYRRLFAQGNMTEAVRAGRQAMLLQPGRICYRGEFPLEDWLVPVVYQQDPPDLPFATAAAPETEDRIVLPPEAEQGDHPYGFIGRDSALLTLERAMRRAPAGILIHGLGGVGKTTLAQGFLAWLADTGGLQAEPFWFSFQDIGSSDYVFNEMVARLFGTAAMAADRDVKISHLVQAFKAQPRVIVWDNFESASGIPGADAPPRLPEADRLQLRDFLAQLRGGKTKVIITSRSPETSWLPPTACYRLPLVGLQTEERWTFCHAIVNDLGLRVQRDDPHLVELMELLDGHPLAMRAMLTQLAARSAQALTEQLRSRLQPDEADDTQAKLFATLRFVEASLPKALQPLLIPLALHERFVHAAILEAMAEAADAGQDRAAIDQFLSGLEFAGLLAGQGQGVYQIHPALTGFLRAQPTPDDAAEADWRRAFVDILGRLADDVAPKLLHEQRPVFDLFGASFHRALTEAEALEMGQHGAALAQSLAAYAQNQRDFSQAEQWYRKSLAIVEKQGNEHGAAITYHQLGMIAEEQRDFSQAEQWYRKSLAIVEKQGNEHGAAITYHQLGRIAEEQRDFSQAEQWYRKSLAIFEKQGNEHGAAITYHQLGMIAQEQRDFSQAEQWYRKSLAIKEKQGNEHGAASTYHQLGMIAQEQRDFSQAEQWYRKSLAIKEKQGNEHGAASTYHQLGNMALVQQDFVQAGQWYIRSIAMFTRYNDRHHLQVASNNFLRCHSQAPAAVQAELQALWEQANLGPFPSPDTEESST